jgi:CubicO group peptidase (beta-lactamase class C family)
MKLNKKTILFFFFSLIVLIGYSQNIYNYTKPVTLKDGWQTSSILNKNIDTTLIHKAFTQLLNIENEIHSILLIKNNELVLEEYYKGYTIDKPHDLRSVTKSIVAILLGIALDKSIIEDINDPISKYLKSPVPTKNIDKRKNQITIKNLITMSSGLDCDDWNKKSKGQEDKVYKRKDWLQYTLNLPMIHEPGSTSTYCTMGVVLTAEIISQASGLTIDEFAKKHLFIPLQIDNFYWGHTSKKEVIPSAKRVYMTPRDLAKIGQLVLNNGTWKGQQIVSKKWIEEATTPKTKITNIDYGYLWWNIPFNHKNNIIHSTIATGNGGQYIMILPSLNLVAIFTGGAYNSPKYKLPFAFVNDIFIPTFKK